MRNLNLIILNNFVSAQGAHYGEYGKPKSVPNHANGARDPSDSRSPVGSGQEHGRIAVKIILF